MERKCGLVALIHDEKVLCVAIEVLIVFVGAAAEGIANPTLYFA